MSQSLVLPPWLMATNSSTRNTTQRSTIASSVTLAYLVLASSVNIIDWLCFVATSALIHQPLQT